jgi:hypothetical protein
MVVLHNWQESRKKEWYDIVQPLLLEHMPELQNLEGDFWVLYAVELRDNYEGWMDCCDHMEIVIEHHLPPESVWWEYDRFKEALRAAYAQYGEASQERRFRRIKEGW